MTYEKKKELLVNILLIILFCGIGFIFFKYVFIYALPFIIGLILTLIVQKPATILSQKIKCKKNIFSVIFVMLLYILVIGLVTLIGIGLYNIIGYLVEKIPEYTPVIATALNKFNENIINIFKDAPQSIKSVVSTLPTKIISSITDWLTSLASTVLPNIISVIPTIVITIIVTLVAGAFIAKDYDKIKDIAKKHIKPDTWVQIIKIKKMSIDKLYNVLKGYLILMTITFVELSIGITIIGIKNSILLALIIAIIDILPILGVGTVLIPWGVCCIILGKYQCGIGLLILYIIIAIIRNILEPKIIGKQIGLSPIITLMSMYIGLKLFGFIGMVSIPIIITIIYTCYNEGSITTNTKIKKRFKLIK